MMNPSPILTEIMESAIIAKASFACDAQYKIIVVFQKSNLHHFYFVFQAVKENDPPAKWIFKRCAPVQFGRIRNFDDFVAMESKQSSPAAIKFIDRKIYCGYEALRDLTERTAEPLNGAGCDRKIGPQGFWFNHRDLKFDSLPVPKNEVLVYMDFCETCGNKHTLAHFPDGHTICAGYSEMKNNPGLVYMGYAHNMFRFSYRV